MVTTKAWCLHSRPYRETSALVELFTEEYGRIAAVAKGVKRQGKRKHSVLQAFTPLQVSFMGKSDLKTLTEFEALCGAVPLQGERLFIGLYLNELLVRLLAEQYPYREIYRDYENVLMALGSDLQKENRESLLRHFEFSLLSELGYEVPFVVIDEQGDFCGDTFAVDAEYLFIAESGFRPVAVFAQDGINAQSCFRGEWLLQVAQGCYEGEAAATAKRLVRLALAPLLGDKPLQSRALFS